MKSTKADKEFLHQLFVKYYLDKPEPVEYAVCIRCGGKGRLGIRKPYEGLCKKCRRGEFKKRVHDTL